MNQPILQMHRSAAGLVVIDIQERLMPMIHEGEQLIQSAVQLIRGIQILRVPIVATVQYSKGLGAMVPPITTALGDVVPTEKKAFSSCGAPGFLAALSARKITDVILCGIETHVCVCQTALDLIGRGFRVFVVADAVSSRTAQNRALGLDRMRAAGAAIVSVEMLLFELLAESGTPEFKEILTLVK
jgi:nicotinamidase-related amidase